MEDAVKALLDRISKESLNEAIDLMFLEYFRNSSSNNAQDTLLVHDSVLSLKEFFKAI